jgi:hypothetical protein
MPSHVTATYDHRGPINVVMSGKRPELHECDDALAYWIKPFTPETFVAASVAYHLGVGPRVALVEHLACQCLGTGDVGRACDNINGFLDGQHGYQYIELAYEVPPPRMAMLVVAATWLGYNPVPPPWPPHCDCGPQPERHSSGFVRLAASGAWLIGAGAFEQAGILPQVVQLAIPGTPPDAWQTYAPIAIATIEAIADAELLTFAAGDTQGVALVDYLTERRTNLRDVFMP